MERELQELRAVLAAMSEQLRMMNELIRTKDAQIAALTEQVAKTIVILPADSNQYRHYPEYAG